VGEGRHHRRQVRLLGGPPLGQEQPRDTAHEAAILLVGGQFGRKGVRPGG
jgi:hypothetical protein